MLSNSKQIILLPQNDFSRFWKKIPRIKLKFWRKSLGQISLPISKSLEDRLRQSKKDNAKRQAQLDGHFASQVWSEEELAVLAQTPASENWHALKNFLAQRQESLKNQKNILKDARGGLG